MKLINQSYEILGTPKSLDEAWEFAAKAARNCYQSEKTRLNESEEDFCKRLLLKHSDMECNHLSPLEFGIVYLWNPVDDSTYTERNKRYLNNPYSRVNGSAITTNLRTIYEHGWQEDLQYAGPPTEYHMKACTFRLVTNRAVMCELTRHESALSFCVESTRYCNYSKDKFKNALTFIMPLWTKDCGSFDWADAAEDWDIAYPETGTPESYFMAHLANCEQNYFKLLKLGWSPQEAANILPNALKTTIMMCGYEDGLDHVFRLRAEECSGPVHPQMAEIMKPLYADYKHWKSNI